MPKKIKEVHSLDQWSIEEQLPAAQAFFGEDYSPHYLKVKTQVGKRHAWQVKSHEIGESANLEAIFESRYRTSEHEPIVPRFNMLSAMMNDHAFAPPELDLGTARLHYQAKLTDVISGAAGNMGNSGWIISKRLLEILKSFNIGTYQDYKIVVQTDKGTSQDYVYLHFINYADDLVDYARSVFYTKIGYGNTASREPVTFPDREALDSTHRQLMADNEDKPFDEMEYIGPKELVLEQNSLDLFTFQHLFTADQYMSMRLAETLRSEKITGLELFRTSRVKATADTEKP